jgi:hypothetical protein
LDALAIYHIRAWTEAGGGTCKVKFGSVRHGPSAGAALGGTGGATRLLAGVNTARHAAYRILVACSLPTELQGVTMHRPNEPGYRRLGVDLFDEWR